MKNFNNIKTESYHIFNLLTKVSRCPEDKKSLGLKEKVLRMSELFASNYY